MRPICFPGHSNTHAWLMSADAGMDALFFGRMDYQDYNARKLRNKGLEWVWQGSPSHPDARVFTGQLYGTGDGGYGPPAGLDFNAEGSVPVVDDPRLKDVNIDKFVDLAVYTAINQSAHYEGGHILWAMGSDFNYQDANTWYRSMDKLIAGMNADGRVAAMYSTPRTYVAAKFASTVQWELRQDDIFPLADDAHNYWSGFFTSRPALKKEERDASAAMQAIRQVSVFVGDSFGSTRHPQGDATSSLLMTASTSTDGALDDYAALDVCCKRNNIIL